MGCFLHFFEKHTKRKFTFSRFHTLFFSLISTAAHSRVCAFVERPIKTESEKMSQHSKTLQKISIRYIKYISYIVFSGNFRYFVFYISFISSRSRVFTSRFFFLYAARAQHQRTGVRERRAQVQLMLCSDYTILITHFTSPVLGSLFGRPNSTHSKES